MRKYKQFIVGLIVGAMLFSTVTVFAGTQTIEAFFNDIKISVNGNAVELEDANGNPIEPFIYESTTYLPVRAIAEALGMEVKYNETTNTVELAKAKEAKNLENLIELSPEATASILKQNPEVRDTIDENGYAVWKGRPVRLNKDYLDGKVEAKPMGDNKTITEDEYLQVQVRPDGTKYIYPGSIVLHFNRKVAKEYLLIRNEEHPELSMSSGVDIDIDSNNATIDFILRRYDGEKIILMQDVPTSDSGTFLIPYDEYKNNLIPKLLEAVKQYQ